MSHSINSSNISIRLDHNERLISFEFSKCTCVGEISNSVQFSDYCSNRTLEEILEIDFVQVANDLNAQDEEAQFILHMEWSALRSAIAQYLGVDSKEYDKDRCKIISIERGRDGIEILEIILPPKEMPNTLPCTLSQK